MNPARRSKRISDPVEASVAERYFAHKAVLKPTIMIQEASGKPPLAAQQRPRVSKPVDNNAVLPAAAGMTHPGADARGSSTTKAKDPELDLEYPEASVQETTKSAQESHAQTRIEQPICRDSDEEEEWAELAMTVKLCLATAAPAEKQLEEHVKLVIESTESGALSASGNFVHIGASGSNSSPTYSPPTYSSPSSSPTRDASAADRMRVAASLASSRRHDVTLCHAAWPTTHEAPSGEYDFLEISMASNGQGLGSGGWSPTSVLEASPFKPEPSNWHTRKPEGIRIPEQQSSASQRTELPHQPCLLLPSQRVVVDVSFRQQFEVARPTPRYSELLSQLPSVFVGGRQRLRPLVTALATAMNLSLQSSGISVAPWRRAKYLTSKWFPTTDAGTAIPEARTHILPSQVPTVDASASIPPPVPSAFANAVCDIPTTAVLVAAATMKAAADGLSNGSSTDSSNGSSSRLARSGSTKVPRAVTDSLAEMSQLQLLASKEVLRCCNHHNVQQHQNAFGSAAGFQVVECDWKPPAVAAKRRPACREGCLSLRLRLQERTESEMK